jgi:hypothetical protein
MILMSLITLIAAFVLGAICCAESVGLYSIRGERVFGCLVV